MSPREILWGKSRYLNVETVSIELAVVVFSPFNSDYNNYTLNQIELRSFICVRNSDGLANA